jgi:hypothetical protein
MVISRARGDLRERGILLEDAGKLWLRSNIELKGM